MQNDDPYKSTISSYHLAISGISTDTRSTATGVDIEFADLPLFEQTTTIRFTFLWLNENRWEGKDYKVELHARAESHQGGLVASVPNSQRRKSRKQR